MGGATAGSQAIHNELFEIRAHPAGFLGAFATRSIPAGTLVLNDSPLFTLDAPLQAYLFQRVQAGGGGGPTPVEGEDDAEDETPAKDLDEFLERNIKTMLSWKTDEQRRQFWELASTRPDLPPAYAIFATNAVQTHGEIGGMFLLLSRFNSSCRPTLSRPAWDAESHSTKLYALRDIKAGEELTWTYLNVTYEFEGVEARKEELRQVFHFECCCVACDDNTVSPAERIASERRLLRLRRYKEQIRGAEDGTNSSEERRNVLRTMAKLSREEGLWETSERLEKAASQDQ
ncbi:hypothetical protein JCM10908_000909 [Rhodotorula pacifica]|uniref:S-adenosylmethionine-dependent methyltransferase n=1 Tax=Rhodotorula pacifica TaxID=1495444 RepID=UPI003171EC70